MAAPKNITEYFEKIIPLRDQLKTFKNQMLEEGSDLAGVTKNMLLAAGLNETCADYEVNRLDAAKAVYAALIAFDEASS